MVTKSKRAVYLDNKYFCLTYSAKSIRIHFDVIFFKKQVSKVRKREEVVEQAPKNQ